ncbi:MAG: pyridoxamine 5'-phosphate oxidase family protein [Ruminococcus sp.]
MRHFFRHAPLQFIKSRRPFEGKLYFVTNNQKKAYHQLKENGKVEICGMHKGTWIRIEGKVIEELMTI